MPINANCQAVQFLKLVGPVKVTRLQSDFTGLANRVIGGRWRDIGVNVTSLPKVFISHASEDKDRFVLAFAKELRSRGVDAWVDEWEIVVAENRHPF